MTTRNRNQNRANASKTVETVETVETVGTVETASAPIRSDWDEDLATDVRTYAQDHPNLDSLTICNDLGIDPVHKMRVAGIRAGIAKTENGTKTGTKKNAGDAVTMTMDGKQFTSFVAKGIAFSCHSDGSTFVVSLRANDVTALLSAALA